MLLNKQKLVRAIFEDPSMILPHPSTPAAEFERPLSDVEEPLFATLSQRVLQARSLRPALLAEGRRRQVLGGAKDRDPATPSHSTRDLLARSCGLSPRTFDKALAVVEAAQNDPAKYTGVIEQMDRTGNVDRAYTALAYLEGCRDLRQPAIFSEVLIGKRRLGNFTARELAWCIGFFAELRRYLDPAARGYASDVLTEAQVRRAIRRAGGGGKLRPKAIAKSRAKRGQRNAR